jgi:hypothetical protein
MNPSSLIAVVAIDAVLIKRRQSVRDTSATNAAMKPWRHSASMPQGGLADKRDKKVMTAS